MHHDSISAKSTCLARSLWQMMDQDAAGAVTLRAAGTRKSQAIAGD
jgi:hypothetical protein